MVGGHAWLWGGGMCGCRGACVVAGGVHGCKGGMCGCRGVCILLECILVF